MRISTFSAELPRNPWLRSLLLIGTALIAIGLAAVGLLLAIAIATAAGVTLLVRRGLRRLGYKRSQRNIIDGEYTVVSRSHAALPHPK